MPDKMSEDDRKAYDKIYAEEREKIMEAENEKAFLKDKSIGGNAPRPSDDYIDQSLGKQKTKLEIHHEAAENADERFKAYQAEQDQHKEQQFQNEVDRSQRPQAQQDFQNNAKPRAREIFRKQNQNSQKKGRGR